MSHDPFAREARSSGAPLRTPFVPPLPGVLVACRCGVDMTVAWSEAVEIVCFGCGKAFAAPPDRDPPPVFRPEQQQPPDPVALAACLRRAEAERARAESAPRARVRGWLPALALAALLLALLGLGVRLVAGGPGEGGRATVRR